MQARRSISITFAALAAIASVIWLLVPAGPRHQEKVLQAQFDEFKGYDDDPFIETLRDTGPDAVVFLDRQMKRKDSFLRRQYVALWPKLPGFLKLRLKRPASAAATRVKAVGALRQLGRRAPSFTGSEMGLTVLTSALSEPDLRSRAAGALGDLGPGAKVAVPALIKSLAGSNNINGIWALGRIGPEAKEALPLLELKMRQEMARERVYAAWAVWRIAGENAEAKLIIAKALEDPDRAVRNDARNVLVESPEIGSR